MASITANTPTENKLFIENYNILQESKEDSKYTNLTHNYHTVDLVTGELSSVSRRELVTALNIDRSGSMADSGKDGHSALEHTIHTTKNIISYLEDLKEDNPELNLTILVNAFDNQMKNLGAYQIGDEENKKAYFKKLEKLEPRGSTNIEGAFQAIKNDELYTSTPDDNKAHILMTDGKPNCGKVSAVGILESNPSGNQIYIGYGTGHDAKLLQRMAELSNGTYHFVDSIENAGMVYGEIIHGLLYAAVKDITVTVTGAEVYDFTKNKWSNTVKFNTFASQHTQSLILRSSWDSVDIVTVNIVYTETGNGVIHSKTDSFNCYNCTNGESKVDSRNIIVEKQMFRQRALEGLYKAKEHNAYDHTKKTELKKQLIELEKEMKKFMKTNSLDDDAFMLKLVADVFVAYTGIDSYFGDAFIGARLANQGNQRAYEINDLSSLTRQNAVDLGGAIFGGPPPSIYRQTASGRVPERCSYPRQQSAPPASLPHLSMPKPNMIRQSSCYTTPTQATVMRECSQPITPTPSETEELEEN